MCQILRRPSSAVPRRHRRDLTLVWQTCPASRLPSAPWRGQRWDRNAVRRAASATPRAARWSAGMALTGADVDLQAADDVHVQVRQSKTDQEGRGSGYPLLRAKLPLRCPPCAYVRWAAVVSDFDSDGKDAVIRLITDAPEFGDHHVCRSRAAKIDHRAPLFRSVRRSGRLTATALSGAGVHAVIRRRVLAAGFDPEAVERLGGHSLRAGFVTQASAHRSLHGDHLPPLRLEVGQVGRRPNFSSVTEVEIQRGCEVGFRPRCPRPCTRRGGHSGHGAGHG